MIETIFYFLGSIFFFLSITVLAVLVVYSIKILQKVIGIELEIKNTVAEAKNTVMEIKNKVATFSVGIAGVVALLEKLIDLKNKAQNRPEESDGSEKPGKKDKRQKKFAEE